MRQVEPEQAREGRFLQSFDPGDGEQMLAACGEFEKLLELAGIQGEIVWAWIRHGKYEQDANWQVFVIERSA